MDSPGKSKPGISDERLVAIIGRLLQAGVLASAAIVAGGGIYFLIQHHADSITYAAFHLEDRNLRNVPGIFHAALGLRPEAIIQLGLIVLIGTPIARVLLAAIGFYLERDRLYVVVSLIVLAILSYSILHAF
jgi:uncharacterized membrane protein